MRLFFQPSRKFGLLLALVFVIALAIAAKVISRTEPEIQPPSTDTTPVQAETKHAPAGIVRKGYVATPASFPIYGGFAGRISEIYVKEGQTVKAGQPLFKLEASPASAESAPEPTVALTKEYSHYQKLFEQGIISRRELDIIAARQRISPQKSAASNAATSHSPAITTAPVDGIVTGLTANPGIEVQADQPLFSLGSGQPIEIVVPLDQSDLYRVQLGAPVAIEASGQTITGEVSSIFPEVKENAIAAFLAHINLTSPPAGLLQVGMSVTVRIEAGP